MSTEIKIDVKYNDFGHILSIDLDPNELIEHSLENLDGPDINVEYDDLGHILSIEVNDELQQSDILFGENSDILMHFGVKGMRWGVRRPVDSKTGLAKGSVASAVKSGQTSRTDRKTKVKGLVKKVQGHQSEKKKLDEKLAQLSTREIQELNNRIRATQEHRKLSAQEKLYNRSSKKKIADWLLGINQPKPDKKSGSLKDKVEAAKLAKQILDDMLKAKKEA